MKLEEIVNGPDIIMWVVLLLFVIFTIVLLTGHGSGLLAGYNTMSDEEKEQYDAKKLCRGVGVGFLVIDIMILIMALGEHVLPAWFANVTLAVIVLDAVVVIVWGNLKGKRK